MILIVIVLVIITGIASVNENNNQTKLKAACIESKGTVQVTEYGKFKSCERK